MKKRDRSLNSVMIVTLVCSGLTLSGCAELQTQMGSWWQKIQGKQQEQKTEEREKTVSKYGLAEELVINTPVIQPSVSAPGSKVVQDISYSILSPDKDKQLDVMESMTLSGPNLLIELSRKTERKSQGTYARKFEFIIPRDLPAGNYQLITKIKVAGQEKQQTGSFAVKK